MNDFNNPMVSGVQVAPTTQAQMAPLSTGGFNTGGASMGQKTGLFGGTGFLGLGANGAAGAGGAPMSGLGTLIDGIGAIGSIWNSYQQHKMAKEQMDFQKKAWKANLGDQRQSYNTALEDRIRARHSYTGQGEGATREYMDSNRLG